MEMSMPVFFNSAVALLVELEISLLIHLESLAET